MKAFSATLFASSALAQVYPNRGNTNASLEGSFGFGYNVGNDYGHGDSHLNTFGHQTVPGVPEAREGYAYTQDQATTHIYGYDAVLPLDDTAWAAISGNVAGFITAAKVQIDEANTARLDYIQGVLDKRLNRLMEIHQDNLLKIQAPFELQLDLLSRELEDVSAASTLAAATAEQYYRDLVGGADSDGFVWDGRINDYYEDRVEALNREAELVQRTINTAYEEAKPVDEVLYAMRLDWLQGLYVSGTQVV